MSSKLRILITFSTVFLATVLCLGGWYWSSFRPNTSQLASQIESLAEQLGDMAEDSNLEAINKAIDRYTLPIVVTTSDRDILTSNLARKQEQRLEKGETYLKSHKMRSGKGKQLSLYYEVPSTVFNIHFLVIGLLGLLAGIAFAFFQYRNLGIIDRQEDIIENLRGTTPETLEEMEEKIETFREQNRQLSAGLTETRENLKKQIAYKKKLQKGIQEVLEPMKAEKEKLTKLLKHKQAKVKELEERQQVLEKEKEELQFKHLAAENELKRAAQRVQSLIRQQEERQKNQPEEMQKLKQSLQDLRLKQKQQEEEKQKLKQELDSKEKEVASLSQREKELAARAAHGEEVSSELEQIRAELRKKQADLEKMNKNYKEFVETIQKLEEEKLTAENSLKTAEDHLEGATSELQAVFRERDELVAERNFLMDKIAKLEQGDQGAMLKEKEEAIQVLMEENHGYYQQIRQLQQQIQELQAKQGSVPS